MEALTEEAIKIVEQKLTTLCGEKREWEIKDGKFLALRPLDPKQESNIEEKLNGGIIVVDKPPGPTSHEVVAYLKKMLGIKKAGHGGTLEGYYPGETHP
ncbi:MAG: tRNA pseudouridine synthase A [Fervidicoccaceae archaeon]